MRGSEVDVGPSRYTSVYRDHIDQILLCERASLFIVVTKPHVSSTQKKTH